MECYMKEFPFTGQFLDPPPPPANIPNKINDEALMALPFIGLLVGVDGHVPTHAAYAIYDSSVAGLRFVWGDGELVIPEQVCFTKTFKDGMQNLSSAQKISKEICQRATRHYQFVKSSKRPYSAQAETQFPTLSSVKTALTYISDLHSVHCTSLQGLPISIWSQSNEDEMLSYISVTSKPEWNFDVSGFEAFPTVDYAADFQARYLEFVQKYKYQLHPINFQHAAFCLVGLEKAGLISFVQEGLNDQRNILQGQIPPLLPTRRLPWHVSKDWTVDCFLARFGKFEGTFSGNSYAQHPNPILWLEAEMEYEERLNRKKNPWKQEFNAQSLEESDVVVDWAFLKSVKWQTRGEFDQYPKPATPKSFQPLKMNDIISKRTGKFKKSKNARRVRKEKNKASNGVARLRSYQEPFDLTGDESPDYEDMKQYVSRKSCSEELLAEDLGNGYLGDQSEVAAPSSRKRKHGSHGGRVKLGQKPSSYEDSNPRGELRFQQLISPYEVKSEEREISPLTIDEEDLGGTSDLETNRELTQKCTCRRSESPDRKTFISPPSLSPLTPPHKRRANSKLPVRPISGSARPKTRHLSLHYGGLSKLPPTVTLVSDSDDSSDFPEVEDIITQSKYAGLLSSRPSQPAESATDSFAKKPKLVFEACDDFEKKYMLNRSDPEFTRRVRSPTLEEESYPSIEHTTDPQNDPFDDSCVLGFKRGINRSPYSEAPERQTDSLEGYYPPSSEMPTITTGQATFQEEFPDLLPDLKYPTGISPSSSKATSVPVKREEIADLDLYLVQSLTE